MGGLCLYGQEPGCRIWHPGDGAANCVDTCPLDPNKTAPGICGCGTLDVDSDGDGTADCLDLCPADPAKLAPGGCGCGVADTDGDGDDVADCDDVCVDSDRLPTVAVDGCDTGVANPLLAGGCTLSDEVLLCAENATNRGRFVSCVAHLTRDWKRAGVIDGAEKGAIDACAGQSPLP